MLHFKFLPVHGSAIEPRRSACLQASPGKSKIAQLLRQQIARCLTISTARILRFAHMCHTLQESASGHDHRSTKQITAICKTNTVHLVAVLE